MTIIAIFTIVVQILQAREVHLQRLWEESVSVVTRMGVRLCGELQRRRDALWSQQQQRQQSEPQPCGWAVDSANKRRAVGLRQDHACTQRGLAPLSVLAPAVPFVPLSFNLALLSHLSLFVNVVLMKGKLAWAVWLRMDCLCIVTTKVRSVREDGNECEREEAFLSFQLCVRVGCWESEGVICVVLLLKETF